MAVWLWLSTDGCVLLAWQISDQTWASGNCDRGAMWLSATETQSADQTSVSHRHTQAGGKRDKRDKRKPELHPSHYNDALGCVTLNFCVWAHVFHILSLVRWALRVSLVTHWPPGTAWQLQEKQETGSVKAWNSLSALCKHISLTLMELWFPNQYQISASTLSGGRLFGHKWSKTKLLQLIYAAYSFHCPQGLSR